MRGKIVAYVVAYQTGKRKPWYEYFKWFKTKQEATQWVKDHPINNPQTRYRIKPKREFIR